METEEEDDTNDEDFNVEIRQFSSCSHRFSKVSEIWYEYTGCLWPDSWYPSTAGSDCENSLYIQCFGLRSPNLTIPSC